MPPLTIILETIPFKLCKVHLGDDYLTLSLYKAIANRDFLQVLAQKRGGDGIWRWTGKLEGKECSQCSEVPTQMHEC